MPNPPVIAVPRACEHVVGSVSERRRNQQEALELGLATGVALPSVATAARRLGLAAYDGAVVFDVRVTSLTLPKVR